MMAPDLPLDACENIISSIFYFHCSRLSSPIESLLVGIDHYCAI